MWFITVFTRCEFDDKVYGGITTPNGIVFTELEDFSNDRA